MAEAAITSILLSAANNIIKSEYDNFKKHFDGEQTWECWPDEAIKNYQLIQGERKDDEFPQGKKYVYWVLGTALKEKKKFYVKANKNFPKWTWYYTLDKY